jgi:hypothetical protein
LVVVVARRPIAIVRRSCYLAHQGEEPPCSFLPRRIK